MTSVRPASSENSATIAVVGCGYWGRNLVRVFHSVGVLKSICDPYEEARQTAATIAPGVPVVSDVDSLLIDPSIQAIVIATPAVTHSDLAIRALSAGKHVFVEKPLAISVQDGEKIAALADRQKRIVMVGHILSYHPAIVKLKELIDQGELGKILYINSHRLNFGKVRREENILWSFAPHDISTILMLLNELPSSVSCSGGEYIQRGVYDLTLTTLDFPSGVKTHIFVSWMHPFKEQKLVVIGDKKMAVFDDTKSEGKLLLYPHTIEWRQRSVVTNKMEGQAVAIDPTEPLMAECLHFLECIRNSNKPRTDAEEGLRVLQILEASEESLKQSGKNVPLLSVQKDVQKYSVHPTAIVDTEVEIGEGTRIWHFSHILSNSKIGKNCVISQNVMIGPNVTIGDNVKIQNTVSVYEGVTLESDVFCGPSMVFTNVINPRSAVPRKSEFRKTHVARGASLGANCTILAGVAIGRFAFIGAGAVVTKDVPDYALVTGVPARVHGWMCQCGIKLRFKDGAARCESCKRTYRMSGEQTVEQVC